MLLVVSLTGLGVQLAQYVLALFSLASVAVIIERAITLRRARAMEGVVTTKPIGELTSQAVLAFAHDPRTHAPSVLALTAGLQMPECDVEWRREAVQQSIAMQIAGLQQRLSLLGTIASTAPYIGLFGTVLGILKAFHDIAVSGQTGASVVAGGISEALITTALGLGVAIPAVIAYNSFSARINEFALEIETHTLNVAARLPELNTEAPCPAVIAEER